MNYYSNGQPQPPYPQNDFPQHYYPNYNYYAPYPQPYAVYPHEKRLIRKNFSKVGLLLMIHEAIALAAALLIILVYKIAGTEIYQYNADGQVICSLPFIIYAYFSVFASTIILSTAYFCRSERPFTKLWGTSELSFGKLLAVAVISLGVANSVYIVDVLIDTARSSYGFTIDIPETTDPVGAVYVLDIISAALIAPITEEIFYRGIIMTNLCKVSKRFGIVVSALIFGLAHGNIYQFLLGFIVGMIFAYADIEMKSLIPSVIAHIVINSHMYLYELIKDPDLNLAVQTGAMISLAVIGTILLIVLALKKKLPVPEYTEYHRKRTLPVMICSVPCWIMLVYYIYNVVSDIKPL